MWFNFILCLLSGLVLFFIFTNLFRSLDSQFKRILLLLVTGIFAVFSFTIPIAYFSDVIGSNPLYAQFRSYNYTEMLVVLFAPFIGTINGWFTARKHNSFYTCVCLVVMFLYISSPFLKPLIRPLQHDLKNQWKDDVAIQSTASTCGPSSLATIFKLYGKNDTESNIATYAYTSSSGSESWYLARYAHEQGFNYQFLQEPELAKVPTPSIIGVRLGIIGHFIVLLAHKNGMYEVADPISGKETLTLDQFNRKYKYTGFVLNIISTKVRADNTSLLPTTKK